MLTGKSIIGFGCGKDSANTFHAFNPQTGGEVEPEFHPASLNELNRAVELANEARRKF